MGCLPFNESLSRGIVRLQIYNASATASVIETCDLKIMRYIIDVILMVQGESGLVIGTILLQTPTNHYLFARYENEYKT